MSGQEKTVSKLWKMYEQGRAYQEKLGLTDQIPKNVDFYEGRQWPEPTTDTKDLPRPVVNFVKFIVRNKKSSIVGSPVSIVYVSDENPELAEKLTAFNHTIENEMDMESVRNRMAQDAIVKGSGWVHYYWDAEALSEQSDYTGGLRAEVIDPLNIFFANPQEEDEQKQKWILIASRCELKAVKQMLDGEHKHAEDLIRPDDAEKRYSQEEEQEGSELVTVLTRYFRKDGEVYYERACKGTMLHNPISLTPEFIEIDLGNESEDDEDAVETELPDKPEKRKNRQKMTLYPIQAYSYEPREKSIYGMGEVDGIIPNQRAINFNLAMQLLSIQNIAWGKYVVKPGALKQKINNKPGQVITDYSPIGTIGIRRMEEPSFPSAPLNIVDMLTSMTRTVTGSTEVLTGEQVSSNQSGEAIANLQSQALKPIQELRDRYLRSCKRGGRIVKQFYLLFCDKKPYQYKTNESVSEEVFNSEEFDGVYFDVNVEASAATPYSESLVVSLLGGFLAKGYIDFDTYLELLPAQIATFKASLKKQRQESQAAELKNAQELLAQYQQYLEAMQKQLAEQGKTVEQVDRIIAQNRKLQQTLAALQTEYTDKINTANQVITAQSAQNAETTQDARSLALMLANTAGGGQA